MFKTCFDLHSGAHQRSPVIRQFAAAILTEQWVHFHDHLNLNIGKKEQENITLTNVTSISELEKEVAVSTNSDLIVRIRGS